MAVLRDGSEDADEVTQTVEPTVEESDGITIIPGDTEALGRWARFRSSLREFIKNEKLGVASAAVILIVVFAALFAGIVATKDPIFQHRSDFLQSPNGEFLLGTDDLGRDIFSRILYGARVSLLVGGVTILVSTTVGTALGILSGYLGKWVDLVTQRIVDAVMSIPVLILALFIVALFGTGVRNVILALSVVYIPRFARIARGEMLRVRESDYVDAAEALGSGALRVMIRHGLPNITAPIIIMASLTFGQAIIAEAALSFLGLGTPPPDPSWGRMLAESQPWMQIAWWMVIFPGVAIALSVLAFNLFGDALRDHFDPKLVR